MTQNTSSPKKSYNVEALRGGNMDDMEVVEFYGLDPSVAYTPKILDAALEANYMRRVKQYVERGGMDEADARKLAKQGRDKAASEINMVKKMHKL